MLVVADDEVIGEVDVEDVACFDEFGGYFFVGSAWLGVAGSVVVDDHDRICIDEEGAFVDFARGWTSDALKLSVKMNRLNKLTANMVRKQFFMMESSNNHGWMSAEFLSKINDIAFRQCSRLND